MQAWNLVLPSPIGTITRWSSSPWTAGPSSKSQASDVKQQWEEACLKQMLSASLDGEELKCVSHYSIPLHCMS